MDTNIILISNKISSGEKNYKYFVGWINDDYNIKPIWIMLPKTSVYLKSYNAETIWMQCLIEDDDY